jgi:hypothetical protein
VSPSHGYPPATIQAAETRLGVKLPRPLRDYYLSVGRHKLNQAHNRLLPPPHLHVSRGRLVFMEENQGVYYWGVRSRSEAADPVVLQTTDPDEDGWTPVSRCSRFLTAMLCWQAVNLGLPYIGYSDWHEQAAPGRLFPKRYRVGRFGSMTAYVRNGQVVCVEEADESAIVFIGARTRRAFQALVAEVGITIHRA